MDDMCGVCRTALGAVKAVAALELQLSHVCGVPLLSLRTAPRRGTSAPKVCIAQPWVPPLYHVEHNAPALRSPLPTGSQLRWMAAHMHPRMRCHSPAVCCATGCACAARCTASRHMSMNSRSRCHTLGGACWAPMPGGPP